MFRIDILKYSTLSYLAFAIFRTTLLKDSKIPLIHGEMYDFIKESYTGGVWMCTNLNHLIIKKFIDMT